MQYQVRVTHYLMLAHVAILAWAVYHVHFTSIRTVLTVWNTLHQSLSTLLQ
jgi:hypothetical protein